MQDAIEQDAIARPAKLTLFGGAGTAGDAVLVKRSGQNAVQHTGGELTTISAVDVLKAGLQELRFQFAMEQIHR